MSASSPLLALLHVRPPVLNSSTSASHDILPIVRSINLQGKHQSIEAPPKNISTSAMIGCSELLRSFLACSTLRFHKRLLADPFAPIEYKQWSWSGAGFRSAVV